LLIHALVTARETVVGMVISAAAVVVIRGAGARRVCTQVEPVFVSILVSSIAVCVRAVWISSILTIGPIIPAVTAIVVARACRRSRPTYLFVACSITLHVGLAVTLLISPLVAAGKTVVGMLVCAAAAVVIRSAGASGVCT